MSIVSTAVSTALAPFTHYIYGAIIAALLAGFGWYTIHERSVEHTKDIAAELTEIKVVAKKDILIEQTADAVVAKAEVTHEKLTSAPPVSDIGLVCHDTGGGADSQSAAGNQVGAVQGQPVPGDVFDPSGDLLTNARLYAATIGELQVTVQALRDELAAAAKDHQVKL